MSSQHFSAPTAAALLSSALRNQATIVEVGPGETAFDDDFDPPPRDRVIATWRDAAAREAVAWANQAQHLPSIDSPNSEQAGLPETPMAVMRWIRDVLRCYLALETPVPGRDAPTADDFAHGYAHGDAEPEPGWISGWLIGPPSTGRVEWDVMLAAVTEHEFTSAGHTAPAWTRTVSMGHDWIIEAPFDVDVETLRRVTPEWLAKRRIFGLPGSI